jgi:hypothetical protein
MRDIVNTANAVAIYGASYAEFYRDIRQYGPPPRIKIGMGYIYEPDAVRAWAASIPRAA